MIIDQMIDIEGIGCLIDRPSYVFENCTDKWKTVDGTKLYPKEMSTLHIRNSVRMIERICKRWRLKPNYYPIYKSLRAELRKRQKEIKEAGLNGQS